MSLKTVIETTDGLDEALKPFYAEKDGKFFLQIEGVDEHPDVKNLKVAYERTRDSEKAIKAERDTLKTRLASLPDDFDPEKWAKVKDGKPDEAALIKIRQTLEAERDEWKGKFEQAVAKVKETAIQRDLTDALTANGVTDPAFIDVLRIKLGGLVKSDEDGNSTIDIGLAPMAIAEGVKRFLMTEGKAFVDPGKGGGAKGGNGNGAPLTKEAFAAMGDKERIELFRTDPETFKRLSAA